MPAPYIFRSQLNELIHTLLLSGLDRKGFDFSAELAEAGFRIQLPMKVVHVHSRFSFEVDYYKASNSYFRVTCFLDSEDDEQVNHKETWKNSGLKLGIATTKPPLC